MIRQLKEGGSYYYQFILDGKRFNGVCKNCSTKRDAENYEKKLRSIAGKASDQKTVKAFLENFRDELSGGSKILLDQAFNLSIQKPRKRTPSPKLIARKQGMFLDFVGFMKTFYPEVKYLTSVLPKHAEQYINLIRESGRFEKNIVYSRGGKTISRNTTATPSNKTANDYLQICAEVFRMLARDAGITDNPFNIPKLKKEEETREAFTEQEIVLIRDHLTPFIRPLFTLAMMTALREGDICRLKWENIDFQSNIIRKRMNKTRHEVEIPIFNDLREYLLSMRKDNKSEFVFPQHAEMYRKNPSGVSYRVKQFLEGIGIKTTRIPEGRERAVSVKDLQSCRHTFCYYAGIRGIPLSVVQSIVGHMSPEMTKHYSAHATLQDKRNGMSKMINFIGGNSDSSLIHSRGELLRLAETIPEFRIHEAVELLKGLL